MAHRVLIVDDEKGIRSVLRIYLEDMGYDVLTAASGKTAVNRMTAQAFDIVLTDIRMPGMTGIDLLHHIKKHAPDTEVIMITGHEDTKAAVESLKADAVDFITKPIDRDILEIALKRANDRISTRKQIQHYTRNLETMVQEKVSHLADIGLHISTVSHSLKQVVTGIDGGTYLIESGLKHNRMDRINEGWDMVKEKLVRTRTMALEILQHAKKRPLEKTNVSVSELCQDVCRNLSAQIEQHNVDPDLVLPDKKVMCHVDKTMIFNALTAILENAIDVLKKNDPKNRKLTFSAQKADNSITFHIRDNGNGIEKEQQAKIFDLFYSTKGAKGTGLGLFIAAKSIHQHNGTLTVDSNPGEFTQFTITLPAD